VDNDICIPMSSAVSMQLRSLSINDKTGQQTNEKQKRISNERRVPFLILLCFPVFFSSSNSVIPVLMSAARIAESRPKNPRYSTRITECRYPDTPEVSIVLASMNPVPREEFSSNLKNCLDPRGFRWAAMI
jgi:hypothetical protein